MRKDAHTVPLFLQGARPLRDAVLSLFDIPFARLSVSALSSARDKHGYNTPGSEMLEGSNVFLQAGSALRSR